MISETVEELVLTNSSNTFWANRYIKFIKNYKHDESKGAKHHILPKSIFPDYKTSGENIIYLSNKAHFIVHKMLVKVFPSKQMWAALWGMCQTSSYNKITSRLYKEARDVSSPKAGEVFRKSNTGKLAVIEISTGKSFQISCVEYRENKDKYKMHNSGATNSNVRFSLVGKHNWQGSKNPTVIRSLNGTHHCLKENSVPWEHNTCKYENKVIWSIADEIYNIWIQDPKIGRVKLYRLCKEELPEHLDVFNKLKNHCVNSLIIKFKEGWKPNEDLKWKEFNRIFS